MNQPTLREVKELAKQIVAEHPNEDYSIALKEAKEKLIPTVIKAIIAELPEYIEHEPGDNFYPDTFCNRGSEEKFARGMLDENSHYHLYMRHNPDSSKILHYDLCLEDDLQRLINDILWASQIGKVHETTTFRPC